MSLMPFQINEYLTKKLIQDLVVECNNATQVVIKAGAAAGSDDGQAIMVVGPDLTIDITVSGDLGLDTGSEAIDTWYYIWLIQNTSTGVVSAILSASSSTPTLPSGYTKKRLIGAVRNDGSSDFLQFSQIGDYFLYKNAPVLYNAKSNAPSTLSTVNVVPPIFREAIVSAHSEANSVVSGMFVNVSMTGSPTVTFHAAWGYLGNVDSGPALGSSVFKMILVGNSFDIDPQAQAGTAWITIYIPGFILSL